MDFSYIQKNKERYMQSFKKLFWQGTLVVVTKYQDLATTQACINLGIKHIAESRVDAAIKKKASLIGSFTYHMIGHLQTKKVKKAVVCFDVIQSVDSLKLLTHIQKHAQEQQKKLIILLQINATNEPQKYGFSLKEIHKAIHLANNHPYVSLQGCMCMGKVGDIDATTEAFMRTKKICTQYALPLISCGMTQDREIALATGSTMLRIGSGCFNTS